MLARVSASPAEIADRVAAVRAGLARAAATVGRDPADVQLIAVSKRVDVTAIRSGIETGITDLGENYVAELREKAPILGDGVRWHYIGALQSGTAHHVADIADVVHTAGPGHATQRLAARAARSGRIVDALIEVDFTGRRAGVAPDAVGTAAELVATLEGLRLVVLMTIAPPTDAAEGARPWFRRLRELRDGLNERYPGARELSMGMSLDSHVAVQEGATMVRIGTAVFGPRPP
jgi:pyridoxal phosphate enzyme (YggS family)